MKNWIYFVARRISSVDAKGKNRSTSVLSVLGIAFGVMTLIVVMSVMNGFQRNFIDAILNLSSYHIRIEESEHHEKEIYDFLEGRKAVSTVTGFLEAQSLITTDNGREGVALIRAVDPEIYKKDAGFAKELNIVSGNWKLDDDSIIIGSLMARNLGVKVGSKINFFALSGSSDVDLLSHERIFTVSAIYKSGYSDINNTLVFISLEKGYEILGEDARKVTGIKLSSENADRVMCSALSERFPELNIKSWRQYNKSFFGALRIEKNILGLLVFLIFLVVGINIYNGMRRLVFERKNEISLLAALGAKKRDIQSIFVMRGFVSGLAGAFSGLIPGILISLNSSKVFSFISKVIYWFSYGFTWLFNRANLYSITENPMYVLYADIPARVFPMEVTMIFMFGLLAPVIASWLAGRNVLKLNVSEVLHEE